DVWEAGQRVVLRCRAHLEAEFWEQTSIPQDEEILLVGSISCLSARATWRSSAKFALREGRWTAETLIEADGGVIAVELLCDVWEAGQRVVLRCRAHLEAEFWEQTSIPQDEEILLVGSISCLSARATWRSSAKFALREGRWTAETLIEADGGVIAVELLCDVW